MRSEKKNKKMSLVAMAFLLDSYCTLQMLQLG